MKLRKNLINFIITIILFNFIALKSYSLEPKKFVQDVVDEASSILTKTSNKEEKIKNLKNLAKKTADIRGIGYYSLGSHRKSLSDILAYSYKFRMFNYK